MIVCVLWYDSDGGDDDCGMCPLYVVRSKLARYPIFPPGTRSLLCKYLTPDVYEALCDRVTPGGITFQASLCMMMDDG